MSDPDALSAAVSELYWIELSQFTPRRTTLAAQARKSGDASGAKAITSLRKPTKAAFVVNRLFRTDNRAAAQLSDLGAELRKAQQSADAHQMRKLTGTRKDLVDDLTEQAFIAAKESTPTSALREEVAGTLKAALADPEAATLISRGMLLRSVEWDGFGFQSTPELSVANETFDHAGTSDTAHTPASTGEPSTTGAPTIAIRTKNAADRKALAAQRVTESAKEAARAKREKKAAAVKELKRVEKARAVEVAKADKVLAIATEAERDLQATVRRLHDELDTARHDLEKAKEVLRRASIAQRRTSQALRVVPDANG